MDSRKFLISVNGSTSPGREQVQLVKLIGMIASCLNVHAVAGMSKWRLNVVQLFIDGVLIKVITRWSYNPDNNFNSEAKGK